MKKRGGGNCHIIGKTDRSGDNGERSSVTMFWRGEAAALLLLQGQNHRQGVSSPPPQAGHDSPDRTHLHHAIRRQLSEPSATP